MTESFVSSLKIVEAWPSNDFLNMTDSWTNINTTFKYPFVVSKIFGYVKNLERGKRVSIFVPKPMMARYRAIQQIAYDLRHTQNKKT